MNYNSIIPAMTKNNDKNFILTASSVYDATFDIWKAFDGIPSISSQQYYSSIASREPQWIKIQLPEPKIVRKYSIFYETITSGSPQKWIFQGSNDDKTWDDLHSVDKFYPTNFRTYFDFEFDNKKKYSFYRLNILENIGNNGYFYLVEMKLFEDLDFFPNLFLIKNGNSYYSLKPEFKNDNKYNSITALEGKQSLTVDDITTYGFYNIENIPEIFNTIKSFSLVSDGEFNLQINGIKENKEMIVAADDISLKIASNIDYFDILTNIKNGEIKMLFSVDSGLTWNTYKNGNIEKIDIKIPSKQYSDLNTEELKEWNLAKEQAYINGFDSNMLKTIDFNILQATKIRFVYIMNRKTFEDIVEIDTLKWQFDARGTLVETNGVKISMNSDEIYVKAEKDIDLLQVNILNSGEIINGGSGDVDKNVILDLVNNKHSHINMTVLNNISEINGNLAYNGKNISGIDSDKELYISLPKIKRGE